MGVKDSDYEGQFTIPEPRGVYQAGGDTNINVNFAYKAQNIRTERGLLACEYGVSRAFPAVIGGVGVDAHSQPVETFTRFYRRNMPGDPDVFVAACGGALYTLTVGTPGWVKRGDGYKSNRWSYVTYESADRGDTEDVLILSNAQDGMVAIYGSDLRVEKKDLKLGDGYEDVKFAVLGRYGERIWGTGAPGYPDSVFYSKPYTPFDWQDVPETPQLGGGVINQPNWDGDSFIALEPFGGYLLAIRRRSVYEIRGTDPGSYTIHMAYGTDGPVSERTVCTDMLRMYYLSEGGIGVYNGESVQLLSKDALYETMHARAADAGELATACIAGHVYYLALRVGDDEEEGNNTIVEYDTQRKTFMLRTGLRVRDFFALGDEVYFTQAEAPHEILRLNDETARGYMNNPVDCLWETGWLDLGKAYVKRDFVLRFTADSDSEDVPIDFTLITERREKTRTAMLHKGRMDYRVKIQVAGKRVKLRMRANRRASGWRIYGGIQVEYTLDEE